MIAQSSKSPISIEFSEDALDRNLKEFQVLYKGIGKVLDNNKVIEG